MVDAAAIERVTPSRAPPSSSAHSSATAARPTPAARSGSRWRCSTGTAWSAGATGTGKTKTLQLMAEQLSARGCRCSSPTSRATSPGSPRPATRRTDHRAGRRGRPGVDADRLPGGVLRARRHGPGVPVRATHHRLRAAAAVQGARPQPTQESLARPGLPLRRREGPAAARPQGPARGDPASWSPTRARPSSRASAGCPRRPPGSSCAS